MLEVYSQNITVPQDTAVPLNSVSIQKGCTAIKSGVDTIELNRCGVYMVSFDASAAANDVAGDIVIEMSKNGTLQPQAITSVNSTTVTDIGTLSFVTLVQVPTNNSNCCCDSPVLIRFLNTGVSATFVQANVVVTKIC